MEHVQAIIRLAPLTGEQDVTDNCGISGLSCQQN